MAGVCCCSWRRCCEREKRCSLFFPSGEWNVRRALAELLGKPERELTGKDLSWETRVRFEREAFGRCRPVVVEVRRMR